MFCKNCGTQLDDNQKFCPKCGTPVQQGGQSDQNAGAAAQQGGQTQSGYQQEVNNAGYQQETNNAGYQQGGYNPGYQQPPYNGYPQGGQPPKKNSGKSVVFIVIGIIVLIAIVVAVIFGVRSCTAGNSYTDPVESFMEGMEKQDGDKIMDAFSDGTIKALEEESGYSESELADMFEQMFIGSLGTDINVGAYQIDYEILDEEDLSSDEIADIQEEFDAQGLDEKIQDAKALEINMIVSMEELTDETYEESMDLQVIKVGGKWYIDPTSM